MENLKTINDSKLIALLKTLTSKEIKYFGQFVDSPFHNKKPAVNALLDLLVAAYPAFKEDLVKPVLHNQLFKDDQVSIDRPLDKKRDREFRYLMNDLTELIQNFLLYEDMQQNQVRTKHRLSHLFMNRGLNQYVPIILKSAYLQHQKQQEGQVSWLYNDFLLAEASLNHLLLEENRAKNIGLQSVIDQFHQHYIIGQLRYFCAALNRENLLPVTYEYPFLEELTAHLQTHDYSHVPIINVYYRILMLLLNSDDEFHFNQLKSILAQEQTKFPISELRHIYAFIINYCNRQIHKGVQQYESEKLNIYKDNLEEKLWHSGKYISRHQFILIVMEALFANDIEWAEDFIGQYSEDLPAASRKSMHNLSRAYLFFAKKEFDTAHDYLLKVDPAEDFFYEFYYRRLLIQIYYEYGQKYKDALDGALEAFRFYLRPRSSPKIGEHNRKTCSNFLNLLKRICRLRFSLRTPSEKRLNSLKQRIADTEVLIARKWLIQKAEELVEK